MKITIYSKPGCAPCANVKKYLTSKQIPYETIDIIENPEARQHLFDTYNVTTVPVTVSPKGFVIGANYAKLSELIK